MIKIKKITMKSLLRNSLAVAVAATFLSVPGKTMAAMVNLDATLTGSQQVPPVSTPGSGSATVTLDTDSNELSWNIVFSGLTSSPTMAHFHGPAPKGANASVQTDIAGISGLTSPLIGMATVTDTQETDILNGLWYINIHTSTFPSGEIRGQVEQIPEPTTVASILAAGFLGFGPLRRKLKVKAKSV